MINKDTILGIKDFSSLVNFLVDELNWPITLENFDDIDILAFDFTPEELNLPEEHIAKIKTIKQLRPLSSEQPWSVFWIDFEPRKLPITALRRILNCFAAKKRQQLSHRATWEVEDLLFITGQGQGAHRGVTFAHFHRDKDGKNALREFSWDQTETHFPYIEEYLKSLSWPQEETSPEHWRNKWRMAFSGSTRHAISTAEQLVKIMAALAKDMRRRVLDIFEVEAEEGPLHNLYNTFKDILIHDLGKNDFADMYSQTITYGLFSARCMDIDGHFELHEVVTRIPETNPFLKNIFKICFETTSCQKNSLDLNELGINRLVELLDSLNQTNGTDRMQRILREFGRQTRQEDPVIHFYEGFLKNYHLKQKVQRGVFYTPEPVVSFIVRSVDEALRKDFGLRLGLADTTTWGELVEKKIITRPKGMHYKSKEWKKLSVQPFVQILDPATGTGTFLKACILLINKTMLDEWKKEGHSKKEQENLWNEYVPKNLLPRLYGFELMMAPYAVCHMKLGLVLQETGYDFAKGQRLQVYLTNTLEPPHEYTGTLFAEFLSNEVKAANTIKEKAPISVIIGNPPYSGESANKNEWINNLVNSTYQHIDGKKIKEKGKKNWLLDDYVKFIRVSQLKLDSTGFGILGFITNHSYLDNPTFRGMRLSLLKSFEDIYIADLHGSPAKKIGGDMLEDENVFDIKQGVSIGLFIKNNSSNRAVSIKHKHVWGKREDPQESGGNKLIGKYEWLLSNSKSTVEWEQIQPNSPLYLFVPRNLEMQTEYEANWKICDIMPHYGAGIITSRDHFILDFENETLRKRLEIFRNKKVDDKWIKENFKIKDNSMWSMSRARQKFCEKPLDEKLFIDVLYRPFDIRKIYYETNVVFNMRFQVMYHMIAGKNLGLISARSNKSQNMDHFFCTTRMIETKCGESTTQSCLFPLYKYALPSSSEDMFHFDKHDDLSLSEKNRVLNINNDFIKKIEMQLGSTFGRKNTLGKDKKFTAEDIFHYIYALFYSPTYRTRYAKFLKVDFPRVLMPKKYELFKELANTGKKLVREHLLEADNNKELSCIFNDGGDRTISKIGERGNKLSEEKNGMGRLYINKKSFFDNVPINVWQFTIGGYQVCRKWLSFRKKAEYVLKDEDIIYFQNIVEALKNTLHLMKQADKIIDEFGGWPGAFV